MDLGIWEAVGVNPFDRGPLALILLQFGAISMHKMVGVRISFGTSLVLHLPSSEILNTVPEASADLDPRSLAPRQAGQQENGPAGGLSSASLLSCPRISCRRLSWPPPLSSSLLSSSLLHPTPPLLSIPLIFFGLLSFSLPFFPLLWPPRSPRQLISTWKLSQTFMVRYGQGPLWRSGLPAASKRRLVNSKRPFEAV